MFSKSVLFGALAIMPIFVVGTLDIQVLWYVASFVAGLDWNCLACSGDLLCRHASISGTWDEFPQLIMQLASV